jgi:hypothetical protein
VKHVGLFFLVATISASILIRLYSWLGYQYVHLPVLDPITTGFHFDRVERVELMQVEIWIECFVISAVILLALRFTHSLFLRTRNRPRFSRRFR